VKGSTRLVSIFKPIFSTESAPNEASSVDAAVDTVEGVPNIALPLEPDSYDVPGSTCETAKDAGLPIAKALSLVDSTLSSPLLFFPSDKSILSFSDPSILKGKLILL